MFAEWREYFWCNLWWNNAKNKNCSGKHKCSNMPKSDMLPHWSRSMVMQREIVTQFMKHRAYKTFFWNSETMFGSNFVILSKFGIIIMTWFHWKVRDVGAASNNGGKWAYQRPFLYIPFPVLARIWLATYYWFLWARTEAQACMKERDKAV